MKQSCAWAAFLSLSILMGAAAESVTAQNTMDSEEWIRGLRVLTDSGREMSRKLHPDAWSNPYHLWEGRGPIGGTGGSDFSVKMESQISLGVVPVRGSGRTRFSPAARSKAYARSSQGG